MVKLTDKGLLSLPVFSKSQLITFNGSVIYTVDLTEMSESDVELDENAKKVTLWIPHAEQGEINIPASEMEFGDVEKGFLAFGLQADRFAKMTVWEIYQPFVAQVSPEYTFEVSFK